MHLLIALLIAFWFIRRNYKKNKPLIAARIAQEKEKDRQAEKRRNTRRRKWALALADILARRNGLEKQGISLTLKLSDDKRQHLAQQLRKELGLADNLNDVALRQQVHDILCRWPAGIGKSPRDFYYQLASQGRVRDALAFDCMRTAFLTRCIAVLDWCDKDQAWLVLFLNAQRAQDCFNSWQDYATAYVRAREVWLTLHKTPPAIAGRDLQEVTHYLNDRTGNWRNMPWNEFKIFEPN